MNKVRNNLGKLKSFGLKRFLLPLALLAIGRIGFAQEDKDVKEKDVPSTIKEYIKKNYPEATRVKYYKETEGDTLFYQPTFIFKKDRYSLLMFPDGKVYETERFMEYNELSSEIQEKITKDLKARYIKYRIYATQEVNPKEDLKYEIKVRARKEKHRGYYEIFYDKQGNFLKEQEETLKSIPSNSGF